MEIVQATSGIYHNQRNHMRDELLSKEQFAEYYHTYYDRVYKYIYYRISQHYTAEDICSHVFEMVISKYHSFSPEKSNFEVWLFAIARNAVTDYFRSQKKRAFFSLDTLMELVMPRSTPEDIAISNDEQQYLFKALAKLSDKERNILAMKYAADLKNSEIADLLGLSAANIGVVLYRSLKKLHKELGTEGDLYEQRGS